MEASQASEAGSIPVARSILIPDLISPEFFRLRVSDQCWSAASWGVSDLCGSSAVGGVGCELLSDAECLGSRGDDSGVGGGLVPGAYRRPGWA